MQNIIDIMNGSNAMANAVLGTGSDRSPGDRGGIGRRSPGAAFPQR